MFDRLSVYGSNPDTTYVGFYGSLMSIFDSGMIKQETRCCLKNKGKKKQREVYKSHDLNTNTDETVRFIRFNFSLPIIYAIIPQ